jgi:hypothetical protein
MVELLQPSSSLFDSWQREILTVEGKTALPRHGALFVYRWKYILKVSKGA